ncbi:MAG: phosphatidylglycerophosphatase A [Burkholderiales bacterium]|jgi:phosphatidylglycerophosphatase A|nr:phosphatidylglycerophosphatase A [Betaproteobacteria bacterium]
MKPDFKFLIAHPAHFIALGFGAGLAPKAPGTFGTVLAIPIYLACDLIGGNYLVAGMVTVLFVLGIWASAKTGKALGVSDHGSIVIDEVAAFLLVLAFVPSGPTTHLWMAVAFVTFRVFDITKPWPISVADRTIKGGFGVMFDDLLAALLTIVFLLTIRAITVGAVA